jgi:two-component sensor histidine kinase
MRGSGEARTLAIVRDITERRQAEAQIAEKTVLLQEIHHRVKNNLQVIASLLSLQADATEVPETRAALAESQNRVKSMALLHQLLYEHQDFARVDLGKYLRQLAQLALASADTRRIAVEFDLAPLKLDLQRAVPCGLLVNELLSNACKYAFPEGRAGTLRLELRAPGEDGMAMLAISDDGVGLPAGVEIGQTKSLGLQLVPLLAEQFGGQLRVERGAGTRFELRFLPAA